ncbi:trypsin-like peptidase domain-containing protein [Streptomyces carpaticus]|uniref:nSTAND1 domain-containing NTPase n=1 Tax=Streptomyces carpaticus TaxID=285558 RepID=UPI0031F9A703
MVRSADPEAAPLDAALLTVRGVDGRPIGVAFLATTHTALTCAHVLPPEADEAVVVPAITTEDEPEPVRCTVERRDEDIAVLRFAAPPPGTAPVPLAYPGEGNRTVRAFGHPAGRPDGVRHAGVLRGLQSGGRVQIDKAPDSAYEITGGFSGSPVWDTELRAAVGMVVTYDTAAPAAFMIPLQLLCAEVAEIRDLFEKPSPFPGLAAFGEEDAGRFFGRAEESEKIATLVRQYRVVTVTGPSGCGKSSVVRAGVVPLLRADHEVVVIDARSAESVIEDLAQALGTTAEQLTPEAVDRRAEESAGGLVVVIDQLEQLTSGPGPLVPLLLSDDRPEKLRVLITARLDAVEKAVPWTKELYLLPAMSAEQLDVAITAPFAALGGRYADGLVGRIRADMGEGSETLPLLAFTLKRLWEQKDGAWIGHRTYEEVHGVRGALVLQVEEAQAECRAKGADVEKALEPLLLALVRMPPDATRPVRASVDRAELDPHQRAAADVLIGARLVVGHERLELAHEAVIDAWPGLGQRIQEDRDFLVQRDELRADRERWEAAGRPADLLPGVTALDRAARWERDRPAGLSPQDRDFLARGRRRRRRQALRRRWGLISIALALTLASALGTLLVNEARTGAIRAAESASRTMAVASADLRETDPVLSLMLAVGAYRSAPTELARDALFQGYLGYGTTEWLVSGGTGADKQLAASRDGRVIVTVTNGGRATLFVRDADGDSRQQPLPWGTAYGLYPFVTPDGGRVGYLGTDGTLVWFEVVAVEDGPEPLGTERRLPGGPAGVTDGLGYDHPSQPLTVSADGSRVAVADDGELVVWDLDAEAVVLRQSLDQEIADVADLWFGPQDGTLYLASFQYREDPGNVWNLHALDTTDGSHRSLAEGVRQAAVSGDGSMALVCRSPDDLRNSAEYLLLDAATGRTRAGFSLELCSEIAVDESGRRFVVGTGSWSRSLEVADDGTVGLLPTPLGNPITQASGATLHRELLGSGEELSVLVRAPAGAALLALPGRDEEAVLESMMLSPDGATVVGVTPDGSQVHAATVESDLEDGQWAERPGATRVPESHEITFSPDSTLVADRVTDDRIEIRDVDTLEITGAAAVAEPDAGVAYWFLDDRTLLVRSGTVVELWEARAERLRIRVDLADLGITGREDWHFGVYRHVEPGHVAVVDGGSVIRVVHLYEAREVPELNLDTGGDVLAVRFDTEGRYLLLARPGDAVWELWQLNPPRRELGPLPTLCRTCTGYETRSFGFPGDGRVLIGMGDTLRVYEPGSPYAVERYFLGGPGQFLGISRDGTTVLFSPGEGYEESPVLVMRLDQPEEWADRLCEVLGHRRITDPERAVTTAELLPEPVCEPS